jgi:hypothetical protein
MIGANGGSINACQRFSADDGQTAMIHNWQAKLWEASRPFTKPRRYTQNPGQWRSGDFAVAVG